MVMGEEERDLRVCCQRCHVPGKPSPLLGLLRCRDGHWSIAVAVRLRPVPARYDVDRGPHVDTSAKRRTAFDLALRSGKPREVRCGMCGRRLTISPAKLGAKVPPEHVGDVLI
jgi:hypothetical protein